MSARDDGAAAASEAGAGDAARDSEARKGEAGAGLRRVLPRFADRHELGASRVRVSPFCLGGVDDPRVVCAAYDAGVNFFFITADMHWPLYEGTRRGLEMLFERGGGVRDEVVVAVVSYVTQPEFCHMPFLEAIEAVKGMGRVDVSVIGGAYSGELLRRLAEYRQHRDPTGLGVRGLGTTLHDRTAALSVINHNLTDIAYIRYNAAHTGAESEIFPHRDGASKTLVYNFKSVSGYVTPERLDQLGVDPENWRPGATDAYRFVLGRREIDGVLFSTRDEREFGELAEAVAGGPLSIEEREYLCTIADLDAGYATLDT